LNGVMGDHLADDKSPFAIDMDIRHRKSAKHSDPPQNLTAAGGKLVLLIHGLCLSDLDQHAKHNLLTNEPGALLAAQSNYYPLYLRYNSGLHISHNGLKLSAQLQRLIESWPNPIEELSVVAHSMGGLVIRSALYQAGQQGLSW